MNMIGDMADTRNSRSPSVPIAALTKAVEWPATGSELGAGLAMGHQMMNAMNQTRAGTAAPPQQAPHKDTAVAPAEPPPPLHRQKTKFCVECGKPIPKKAKFCPECGGAQQ